MRGSNELVDFDVAVENLRQAPPQHPRPYVLRRPPRRGGRARLSTHGAQRSRWLLLGCIIECIEGVRKMSVRCP